MGGHHITGGLKLRFGRSLSKLQKLVVARGPKPPKENNKPKCKKHNGWVPERESFIFLNKNLSSKKKKKKGLVGPRP